MTSKNKIFVTELVTLMLRMLYLLHRFNLRIMSLEYSDSGLISMDGREVCFDKGSPTDAEKWGMFKSIPEEAKERDVEVSIWSIEECFSGIKDRWSGMNLRSSMDQFKVFCESNDLIFIERVDFQSVIIRHKINCDKK